MGELIMRKFMFASAVVFFMMSGSANAQYGRRQIYGPYYNGWGMQPGLSVYKDGSYSRDTYGGSIHYRPGYVPANRQRKRHYQPYYGSGYYGWPYDYNPSLSPYHPSHWGY